VEMLRPDWLERLIAQVQPGVLVGGQLRTDPHASVDGERFPYLDGWCVAGMRDDLLSLGGFDETLEEPAYYSDNLLSLEARAAGMTLLEVTGGLRHKLNQTAKTDPNVRAATLANQARYQARVRELTVAV
jgi:GT2 family glycosyltransferase